MPPSATVMDANEALFVKDVIDAELTADDGFESHMFTIGDYNSAVRAPFKFSHDPDTVCVLIISTPNMFDVSFKRWIKLKCKELGSLEAVAETISSPIQEFLQSRLEPVCEKFDALRVDYELLHDHSLWPNRKPKILMQTCGHIAASLPTVFPPKRSRVIGIREEIEGNENVVAEVDHIPDAEGSEQAQRSGEEESARAGGHLMLMERSQKLMERVRAHLHMVSSIPTTDSIAVRSLCDSVRQQADIIAGMAATMDSLISQVSVLHRMQLLEKPTLTSSDRPGEHCHKLLGVHCAAYYYQPFQVGGDGWPPRAMEANKKFIGLSLHPVYGGHFAFRSVFIFPNLRAMNFCAPKPLSILHTVDDIRDALEKFNYNWKDSGFRDFGGPQKRYSVTQMEFFGKPPSERWSVLKPWCEE